MKKTLLTLAIIASSSLNIAIAAKGDICINCPDLAPIKDASKFIDGDYYSKAYAAVNGDLAVFRAELIKDISEGQIQLSYSEAWTALTHTDEDPANPSNLILLYKGLSIPKNHNASTKPADVTTEEHNDYWNREHVWAKSHGFPNESQQGYTDIHHLRPADKTVNSARGNKDFNAGGNPNSETNINFSTPDSWEPRDAVKGDVARMMLYMDLRYDLGTATGMPDLVLVDKVGTSSTTTDGKAEFGKLCTLIKWNFDDPVDAFELARNNAVYEYQGNRNPFVDHNEWVDVIYKDVCSNIVAPSSATIDKISDTVEGRAITLTLTTTADTPTYAWEQLEGATITGLDLTTKNLTFNAPEVADGDKETFKFKVTVVDKDAKEVTASITFNVIDSSYITPLKLSISSRKNINTGDFITLSAASETKAKIVNYTWLQTDGPTVDVDDLRLQEIYFTAPTVSQKTNLTFQVTAKDSDGNSAISETTFSVSSAEPSSKSSSSGGSFGIFGILSLLGLGFLRRK